MTKRYLELGLVLGLGLVAAIIIGCGQQGGETSGGVEYFPHTNQYSWSYKLTAGGTIIGTWITSFEGTKTIGTTETQLFKEAGASITGTTTGEIYYVITDAGVYDYGFNGITTTEPSTYLSFPLTVGKSWTKKGLYAAGDWIKTVVAKETVSVSAGTFNNCFKVSGTRESHPEEGNWEWFAPNVGLIKNCTYNTTTETITATLELTSKNF